MEKKLRIALGMVSLSLIAIVGFQLYWTVNAFHVNKKTFENKIDIAMQQAMDSCKKHYFDSIRVMLVKRLSDTSQIKIQIDTSAVRFTDNKGPYRSYDIYINKPNGNRLGMLTPNTPSPLSGIFSRRLPFSGQINKSIKPINAPQIIINKSGNVNILNAQKKPISLNAFKSSVFTVPNQTNNAGKSNFALPDIAETFAPTIAIDNRRWDFYKRMLKQPSTAAEVIAEMSFYVPSTMESIWWVLTSADMDVPENKAHFKEILAKYKGAARDTFLAHGGSFQRVGIGVVASNYIEIEHSKLKKYFDKTLNKQNINAPYYLNLSVKHAKIDTAAHPSITTELEYKYYGMRIFNLSANMPPLYAQAIFFNSKYAVLKDMAFTLVSSLLLIILTALSFVYTIRIILQQKKLADLKDDFINNMTHELKTPIATITVAIEGLQKFNVLNDPDKTQRYLQTSRNELNRLNDLVTKVLNIATFENKDVDMIKIHIEIDELINEVMAYEKAKSTKTVNISYSNLSAVKYIDADKIHFRNLLTNLLDNAVKYSGNPVEIMINCYSDYQYLNISVKDNGIGIATANIGQVFDKFYRVPTGNVHNVKGTGLGLSYVKYIAEAHGGQVQVKSEIDKGTEFIVSLPLNNGYIRILLAEDELALAHIVRESLEERDFKVTLCHDGEQALRNYQQQKPDILVLDVMMPKMDGFELAKQIRAIDTNTPIIFLTARSQTKDVITGFELGANDYLKKPFSVEELIVRIKVLLTKNRMLLPEVKAKDNGNNHQLGDLLFDASRNTIQLGINKWPITARESELLNLLYKNKHQVVPKSTLLNTIWGDDSFFNARSLDVFITRLRRHLEVDPNVQIINIRGVGYKLVY